VTDTLSLWLTAVMDNPELALRIIARFAEADIGVSLDDYGTGLSSLTYLKQIRADELKIDRRSILCLDPSGRDALLVKSTIDPARGCLIGRPVPLTELIEQLAVATADTSLARQA
jgi:EAL domain-containing protein (putative c-di-GMP-specific phosphodiesterase class I)